MQKLINVISLSGGKDSTALWLYALEQGVDLMPVFADTGNEHEKTYEYIEYLEKELGPIRRIKAGFTEQIENRRQYVTNYWPDKLRKDIPGKWVIDPGVPTEGLDGVLLDDPPEVEPNDPLKEYKGVYGWIWRPAINGMSNQEAEETINRVLEALIPTGNPFLDLCMWKGRFPSTKARFCTVELKVRPFFDQVYLPLIEGGHHIISWQGVRAQESYARSKLPEREGTPEGYEIYRPLLNWKVEEVFAMHDKHGIEPNPLYKEGMGRVGCMPCINTGKAELFEIARRYPEEVARIARWEEIVKQVSKRNGASFFANL
ncbi:phosphoadenosine phosphosulfate reductase family protein [Paenibacillus antarcticus]|uniref:Phosphoadenosine phosphosulfate reductase n=1 Tax=Paenibacillus antarcticus TaxID=253703 RepID=A0A168R222_9BACL|nr:phosphoadenosine phosphosulfate reductase family protein [Paenibacillus antarcticus]OAB48486.1 phosphoadenosine phosphosulfate reductase [Paenibacillus antarcticus]